MMHILEQLNTDALTYTPDPRYPFLPRLVVGHIAGGNHSSVTAEECVARGNVRYLPDMTIDGMKADLQQVVQRVCAVTPGLTGSIGTVAYQRPYQLAADEPVVQQLIAAHARVTGTPPELTTGLPAGAFITDAADMVRHGIPTVLYGPAEWRTAPNEGIPIRDLVTAARVYAATSAAIISQPRQEPVYGQRGAT
jgi:acetylornithine deacetylase/succinyl-diaminopimelate desuccinylase-like protein